MKAMYMLNSRINNNGVVEHPELFDVDCIVWADKNEVDELPEDSAIAVLVTAFGTVYSAQCMRKRLVPIGKSDGWDSP